MERWASLKVYRPAKVKPVNEPILVSAHHVSTKNPLADTDAEPDVGTSVEDLVVPGPDTGNHGSVSIPNIERSASLKVYRPAAKAKLIRKPTWLVEYRSEQRQNESPLTKNISSTTDDPGSSKAAIPSTTGMSPTGNEYTNSA
jgi:hypothetical protein